MGSRRGLAALVIGLAALAAGVAVAVERHDRQADARSARLEAERNRYEEGLRLAGRTKPQFAVSYVSVGLEEFERLTTPRAGAKAYRVVPTEVATRLESRQRFLPPGFADLAHPRDLDAVAERIRSGRAHAKREWTQVGALLVSPLTPRAGMRLTLRVDRFAIRGFDSVIDPTDLSGDRPRHYLRTQKHRPATVTWAPSDGTDGDLVPLHILHPVGPSGYPGTSLVRGIVLAPRSLQSREPNGHVADVRIEDALIQPVVLIDTRG